MAEEELEAAVQKLHALVELAEVHVAEAPGCRGDLDYRGLGGEVPPVDAGLIEVAGCEELQSLVKVVHRRGR